MNGAAGWLQGLMTARGVVESNLKFVIITSGNKNGGFGDENSKKWNMHEGKMLIISNSFFFCFSLSHLSSEPQ